MKVEFVDIILFVLMFQLLSIAPFLLFSKNKRGLSNKILAIFILSKALCISNFISFRLFNFTYEYFPHAFFFGSSFTILWGPGIYFYVKSLTQTDFRFRQKDLIHLIPFAVHFLYLFFTFHIYDAETKRILISQNLVFSNELSQLVTGFTHLLILAYLIASFLVLIKYRANIKNSFSSIEKVNLSWMIFVLGGFSLKWSSDVWYFVNNLMQIPSDVPLFLSRFFLFLFINIIIYKGLRQPEIFSGIIESQPERRPFLSHSLQQEYISQLKEYMETKRPHLDPDLTLMDLAEKISIPYRALSEVINNGLKQNYYDFINGYRIRESQKLLSENSSKFKTVLEVLYEVGYNSKSSFNAAFKKHTGMTPTEFKRLSAKQA
ncbi:MAG: helix-turn-helix domain-containing protein [Calditrichaceae bacterium]